jgi:hypothetical protein
MSSVPVKTGLHVVDLCERVSVVPSLQMITLDAFVRLTSQVLDGSAALPIIGSHAQGVCDSECRAIRTLYVMSV